MPVVKHMMLYYTKVAFDVLEITKAFLHCARNTHSRYAEDLERRQQVSAAEQEASMKRKKILKVKELEVKCLRILENA